jgi:hypothetical protein
MPKIQDISRSQLFLSLKFLILGFGGVYIYKYLYAFSKTEVQSTEALNTQKALILIFVVLGFSILNWFGEVKKWQGLVGNLSLNSSAKQSLISHGVALFTPQKLGEYGSKCLFFNSTAHYRIVALTAVGHFTQLLSTLLFGICGIIFLFNEFNVLEILNFKWSWTLLILPGLYFLKPIRQKADKIFEVLKCVEPRKIFSALGWSLFRYAVFAHQFYFLLLCYDVEIPYLKTMAAISLIYFTASALPVFSIADGLVKGSLALTIFGFLNYNSPVVLWVVFLMWMSNTMLPAIIGYLWMFNWKPKFLTSKS